MGIIIVFVVFSFIGIGASMGIATLVEQYSSNASLLVFLALFVFQFMAAWMLAVRFTDRFLVPKS